MSGEGCTRCGQCCNEYSLEMPQDEGMAQFYRYHGGRVSYARGKMIVLFQDRCAMYRGPKEGCAVYEGRPDICRRYLCDRARYGKLAIERKP